MREIQASEAKTHLPQLLDDVERGETIVITRHGRAQAGSEAVRAGGAGESSRLGRCRARRDEDQGERLQAQGEGTRASWGEGSR